MDNRQSRIDVVAAVIKRHDKYFICQRPHQKRHGGLWEFPGGKVDAGETFSDALSRELQEELSLIVTGTGSVLFKARDPNSPFHINFVSTEVTGTPVLHEHEAVRWETIEQLVSLPLAPSDYEFAQTLE